MSDVAIRSEDLAKRYRLGERREPYRTLREQIARAAGQPFRRLGAVLRGRSTFTSQETFWALSAVSFEVGVGEVVGIIGRNGAGKTTLLKILSRITEPTEGRAWLRGRVGSLLEVGTGFHPELTGRENIYLNGAILGMKRAEIAHKFDRIVAFAEVERFIDTPVKFYSSGMYVRLAFSVAAHLDPEILLVDEVLAVGDTAFQRKCISSIRETTASGRTALVVSHNMALVRSLCRRAILIDGGRIVADGPVEEALDAYNSLLEAAAESFQAGDRKRDQPLAIAGVRLLNQAGQAASEIPCGEGLRVEIDVACRSDAILPRPWIGVRLHSWHGEMLCHLANREAGYELPAITGSATIVCDVPGLNLLPGRYRLGVILADIDRTTHDVVERALSFDITSADVYGSGFPPSSRHGLVFAASSWHILDAARSGHPSFLPEGPDPA